MTRMKGHMQDLHNISIIDRVGRFFVGGALMFFGVISSVVSANVEVWEAVIMLLAVYPLMTCIMGWDPFYHIVGFRTGAETGRNVTGTFPYQVDAAMGNEPTPDEGYEYDHSLSGSHHEKDKTKAA